MTILNKITDCLYPPRCPVCDEISLRGICDGCRKKLVFIDRDFCMKCGKPLQNENSEYCMDCRKRKHEFVRGRALLSYRGELKSSIYRMKYSNKREYAYTFGREMAEDLSDYIENCHITVIVPVPLHKKRMRMRGYNQAALIARSIGKELDIPVDEKILTRSRYTKAQKVLGNTDRADNLKGAFTVTGNIYPGERILLVDDIYTTGSTMDSAALALREAGDCRVYALSVAIGG